MVGLECVSVSMWLKENINVKSILVLRFYTAAGHRNKSNLLSSESKYRYCNTEAHAHSPSSLTTNVCFDHGVSFCAGASCGCGGSVKHFVHVHPCGLPSVSWSPSAQQEFVRRAICLLVPPSSYSPFVIWVTLGCPADPADPKQTPAYWPAHSSIDSIT